MLKDVCLKVGGGGKVKRQVWTDVAIEAFSEGLCQVYLYIQMYMAIVYA